MYGFVYISSLFIFIAKNIALYEHTTKLFSQSPNSGHLGCFQLNGYYEYILVDAVPQIDCARLLILPPVWLWRDILSV